MDKKAFPVSKKALGIFTLAMINVAAIVSLRNLPLMAEYGLASIFFYAIASVTFFIPISMVAAELATSWPEKGGIYAWVKQAFGEKYGFLAVWIDWVMNAVWLPTVLSFTAATIAYIFLPALAENKLFMVSVMLVVLWGATFANFFSMKASGLISSVGSISGTIIPGVLIIILGIVWVILGNHMQISFSSKGLIPSLELSHVVFFAGVILGLAGIEMAAFHANEAKNPQKEYPRAIFLSATIILLLFIFGSLSIAVVVPVKEISLVAGLMQAFESFFKPFGLSWIVPIVAFLTAVGALAQISTWLIGPSKGLLATAEDGGLPPVFQRLNKHGMPVSILIIQAIVGSSFSLIFLLMPDVSSSYWILSVLTAQLTVLMYIIIFISAIRLRYSKPDTPRPYKIPGGNAGMWIVAGLGLLACVFTLFIGFVPPEQVKTGNLLFYELFLVLGVIILSLPPFILNKIKKKNWIPNNNKMKNH